MVERVLATVLSTAEGQIPSSPDYGWVDAGMVLDVRSGQDWIAIGGCGMLKPAMLAEAGLRTKMK